MMANKPKAACPTDAQVEAAKQIYDVARRDADLEMAKLRMDVESQRDDSFALGAIKANKAHRQFSEFLDALILYRARKNKNYRQGGLTWEAFCAAAGYDRRTAERIVDDITPAFESFSDNLTGLSGIGLKQIRYLGKTKAVNLTGFDAEGNLVIGDETVPNTPEDILAYINHLKEINQQALEEKDADLRAKGKVLKDKEKVINRQARDLAKYEKRAEAQGLTPEEDSFLRRMENTRTAFDGFYMCDVDPERMEELVKDANPTPRMVAAYLTTLDYMRKQILAAYDTATDRYGNPVICPEDGWTPPAEAQDRRKSKG